VRISVFSPLSRYDPGRVPPPPDLTENPELEPGLRLLERYTILDRVGSGGMASIYRATDERLERIVCVKLLRLVLEGSGSAGEHGVYKATYTHFLQEALALSKLQHPNTLRIYDFGYTTDGRPFQISEFLDGGNLETQVRGSGRFTRGETLGVLELICGAVAEAHQHGIIHRDIKPSNILFARIAVADEGDRAAREVGHALVPKLADFGISSSRVRRATRSDDEEAELNTVVLFSPRWAAPEQLSSSFEGPATDVYALGLITVYMLTGYVLFADPDVKVHFDDRVRGDDFVKQRLDGIGIDPRVRQILLRALTAEPLRRIPSPTAFFEEMRSVLESSTPPTPSPQRSFESITLIVEPLAEQLHDAEPVAPPERSALVSGRRVRIVDMTEKLDFTLHGNPANRTGTEPRPIRFRIALVPSSGPEGFSIHIKGLNCFVRSVVTTREGGAHHHSPTPAGPPTRFRPTPAITASEAGETELVSGEQESLATIRWSFGRASDVGHGAGRVFDFGNAELVIPFSQASQAVAIDLGVEREAIVICKHA
jgi:eukaryotic-like serine/threonine-protein kinase